jgi:hypothetical protein
VIDLRRVQEGHRRFLRRHEQALHIETEIARAAARREVQTNPGFTPRSGDLQRATKTRLIRTRGGKVVRVSNAETYAAAIDKGAKPHTITARSKPYLHFRGSRGWVRVRSVNHPGNRPYHFLSRATHTAAVLFGRRFRNRMREIARSF